MQLGFGYGLKNNIADAYRFLMLHYEPGDRIALFGYSRGAYTVRGLAGLLQVCGLLRRGNEHLIPYALKIYMNFRLWNGVDSFRVNCHEDVQVDYMGVWDTVSSMYWENRRMPHTYRNPILRVVRHAISVDEKRAFFRTNRFGSPHPGQDIREAWFPGVHGNVGGGHPRGEREPELATFDWVVQGADLDIDPAAAKRLTEPFRRGSVGPQLHESLKGCGGWQNGSRALRCTSTKTQTAGGGAGSCIGARRVGSLRALRSTNRFLIGRKPAATRPRTCQRNTTWNRGSLRQTALHLC